MTSAASVGSGEKLRLFLALRLPGGTLDALEAWQARALSGGRIVPREHLHVTLAFLGARPADELEGILGVLRGAAARAARPLLRADRYRETRSVGMLVLADEDARAGRIADDVQRGLEALGAYRREARPWLPHVTLLRFRERPRLRPAPPDLGEIAPSEAAAYLSRLHPSGARYELLESVPLGG